MKAVLIDGHGRRLGLEKGKKKSMVALLAAILFSFLVHD